MTIRVLYKLRFLKLARDQKFTEGGGGATSDDGTVTSNRPARFQCSMSILTYYYIRQ